jgi:hypothetical protein
LLGYYCHTSTDQCLDDTDCNGGGAGIQVCTYVPSAGHWECKTQGICP